ncbi:MAG TPA: hypothetical protein VMT89_14600 [Candidatus Acidoferrales bacterium]|nr:hypothetical protein [Candidatus Acidoferrales bacterium]
MTRLPLLVTLAVAAAVFVGCSDGGPVGTGISGASGISGNVVSVDTGSGAGGAAAVGLKVRVSIDEVPGLETETDADGNFAIDGDFSGAVTVRFTAADVSVAQQFDVPDQSNLVLEDVAITRRGITVDTVRLLGFYGQVSFVDCTDGTILVNDRRRVANQFMVQLSSGTALSRGNGQTLACADISPGNFVAVEGVVRFAQHVIEAVTLIVGLPPPGTPPPQIEIAFHGRAVVINCPGGMALLDDPTIGRTRLRLSSDTIISNGNQQRIRCQDIAVGDVVSGRGTINTRRPGVVDARILTAQPPPS